ncbi:RE1-silencing transcription factor isoform X1 [Ostrinia furnacalis]|uniref:RE1-silencing transcription factor isoform X1 n=2 Tax=Ostrinia furnacalis TaxID=93504 RepID=UPI00103A935A|nr:RE1-silencing transcription factor isoform X1 [Ostrinia furnacalis]XP_028169273.1 RE1-silencing transcription factor isoform X1 [Ostrinia furnacalis]
MQGAASAPAPPAAEPPSSQQIKTEEVITEAKVEAEEMEMVEKQDFRPARTTSIDSDNRSDRSEEEDTRRSRKRAASTSPSPITMDKRIARFECPKCRLRFDSANTFDLHRFTAHGDDTRAGFDDLTFVDFSSKKFPEIARGVCERNPHISVTEQRYRCDLCTKDFPCGQALDIHRKTCTGNARIPSPERDRREDFFAKLDLRNRSFGIPGTLTPPMDRFTPKFEDGHLTTNGIRHIDAARDLADIQSILNVTSAGSLLERLTGTRVALESAVLTPPDTASKDREHEETQDNFAAEFRRMKLRGEFPCRLCPAKFPNLRALKGHNRVHLSGTGPGPYQCNMCPHASLDKAALVRHMRTHNGDRPYECAVCNYAFTTKANCERHLRNRHAKVTREDVKRSIIYHPSEDPNNDEVNSKLARDDVKRSLAFQTPEFERRTESTGRDTPLTHFTPTFIAERHPVASLTAKPLPETPILPPRETEQPLPRIKVKGIGQLTQIPEYRPPEIPFKTNDVQSDTYDEEAPVDLSTSDNNSCDVLDLSKKKRDTENDEPKPPPRPSFEPDPAAVAASTFEKARLLIAQQRLFENTLPKIDPAYYASQLSQLYAGTVPGIPGLPLPPSFPISPYFLQPSFFPHPTDSQELAEIKQRIQKEIIRGLSMSGGRLVPSDQEAPTKQEPEEEDQKPIPQPISPSPSPQPESPRPLNNTGLVSQNDSVKMVIKNGILMPKQKQRRYRTERPFSCSQCSARFTLRSNMERHVKQQHPQHWSVRRPAPRAPPPYPTPDALADRVKYALLARHLERPLQQPERSPIRRDSDEVADNEEDEDDTLVIDEEPEDKKPDEHSAAHRAAAEILMATRQQELHKDFDLKIAGNLINKPVLMTPEKTETGTDPIQLSAHDPVPVVPTRSDEEEDEEGLVASTSEGNNSGSDENKSESDTGTQPPKKKSAYSLAPNRVSCPYCHRKFPWSSSLRRHVLTHTGQKPFKCPHCPLLFTTKSNCDRHLLRKHGGSARAILAEPIPDAVPPSQAANDSRAVPERPFKCASCPSSTFSSMDTLKKHMTSRHGTGDSQPGSPNPDVNDDAGDVSLVFKCHLCEASFGERGAALGHLATTHSAEYEQLVNKGALDAASDRSESADDDERGRVPDHVNRKVVCAFCVRRFWSAEDLRRHVRTHSGERPFACDLCRRRFTLKHSMLRHRKKHREETDDEEASPPNTPVEPENLTNGYRYQDDDGSGNEIPSNVNNNNSPPSAPYEKKLKLDMTSRKYSSEAENDTENGGDLIGKLLGIPDKTIINKLLSSADEAAKFLGVNK